MKRLPIQLLCIALFCGTSACKTDCASQSVDECSQSADCEVIRGSKVVSGCPSSKTGPVACHDGDLDCDDAETFARDANGTEWLFSNSCIPGGWTAFYPDVYPDCE